MISATLAGLRDVDDVRGSFLLGAGGELVARDLPAVFDSDLFAEVGPRLLRLRETLESDGDAMSSITLRFGEHRLYLRTVGKLLLGVIATVKVNGPALRMAINLVTRRVASHANDLDDEPTPPKAPAPGPALPTSPPVGTLRAPGVTGRQDIVFRGRKL